MRVDRLLALADFIEQSPIELRMPYWNCGTAACIGGHCNIMISVDPAEDYSATAANYLGLDLDTKDALFFCSELWDLDLSNKAWNCDKTQAANVVRRLAVTGEVRWDLMDEPVPGTTIEEYLRSAKGLDDEAKHLIELA